MKPTTSLLVSIAFTALLSYTGSAKAAMFKCTDGNGKTTYSDQPCAGDPNAKAWTPKQPLNVVRAETLTGRKDAPAAADKRPEWLRAPSPVGDCKKRGGKIDPELRACILP